MSIRRRQTICENGNIILQGNLFQQEQIMVPFTADQLELIQASIQFCIGENAEEDENDDIVLGLIDAALTDLGVTA